MYRLVVICIACMLSACQTSVPTDVQQALLGLPDKLDYNFEVQPILSEYCYPCHGPDENTREANLRLDLDTSALAPREGGAAIVNGAPLRSALMQRIFSQDPDVVMPPPAEKMTLSPKEKATLYRWIEDGAEWKPHWAYSSCEKNKLPQIENSDWPHNAIDYFILAKLESLDLQPSYPARKETLLRRVTLDLTGLPPKLEDLANFMTDESTQAYEKVVDRLLASPHFGERWCWDWLDAARYSDTNGFQGDPERKMWPWRDWVINAINDDMPYDQFTVEQLGGDLLPNATNDQILATAFNRNHTYNGEGGRIAEETRVENVFDRTETVGTLWLGMTLNCCRCHDHKFDNISQKEYYQFFDFFNQTSEPGLGYNGRIPPVLDLSANLDKDEIREIEEFLEGKADEVFAFEKIKFPREEGQPASASTAAIGLNGDNSYALTFEPLERTGYLVGLLARRFKNEDPVYFDKLQNLRGALQKLDRATADNLQVMVMDHLKYPRQSYVLERGNYEKHGTAVSAGVPQVINTSAKFAPGNRLELAEWLVHPDHPLTARVTVNRLWQSLFGQGLVKTPEDFGVQGAKPSHPKLLDWLARDFIDHDWKVKRLIKMMVMSATYRQSSAITSHDLQVDPDNVWLARAPRHRLPSWMIRDQALHLAGLLSDSIGGPSVKPYQPPGIWEEATFGKKTYVQDQGEDLYRRSLYTFWRRIVGPTMLFDNSARQVCSVKPIRTNSPLHALTTLNDIAYVEAARVLALRVMDAHEADEERLNYTFKIATARLPTPEELSVLQTRLSDLRREYAADLQSAKKLLAVGAHRTGENYDAAEWAAFTGICTLILNLDEVLSRQ